MVRLVLLLALIISCSLTAFAPSKGTSVLAPEVGSISVAIFPKDNAGHAVFNGRVIVSRSSRDDQPSTATADQAGYYIVRSLLPGPYRVTANAPGYKPSVKKTTVKKYQSTELNIILVPAK